MAEVTLDTSDICDWDSFYSVTAQAFGFPEDYERNFDEWVAHLSFLDNEEFNTSSIQLQPGELLIIHARYFSGFLGGTPELAEALLNCIASVNHQYLWRGEAPRLALIPL